MQLAGFEPVTLVELVAWVGWGTRLETVRENPRVVARLPRSMRDISDATSPAATIAHLPARSPPAILAPHTLILPPELSRGRRQRKAGEP